MQQTKMQYPNRCYSRKFERKDARCLKRRRKVVAPQPNTKYKNMSLHYLRIVLKTSELENKIQSDLKKKKMSMNMHGQVISNIIFCDNSKNIKRKSLVLYSQTFITRFVTKSSTKFLQVS